MFGDSEVRQVLGRKRCAGVSDGVWHKPTNIPKRQTSPRKLNLDFRE
ncbi:hypothetical protein RESH_02424 [Rhodopirellula europaea SH398]|uniref:Uncharacterized protein n=1 Tax=Rhodopirellula europaea SH398 TaxID=1263868 RepID=M5S5S4_9BACT|nr:hypothetical protein RESH_02424 [Rhodopirellula europaea SH398]